MRFRPALSVTALVTVVIAAIAITAAQPTLVSAPSTPSASVDPKRLEAHVRTIVGMGPRDSTQLEHLDAIAQYIANELRAAGIANVHEQRFDDNRFANVIARLGPSEAERIVIGAHYDAYGPLPAADDNASGVAALIELGRLLARTPPPVSVELVAYTLEEPPFFRTPMMGSVVHAESLHDAGAQVRGMISLEMLGYFSETQEYPASVMGMIYPSRGDFVAVVGDLETIGLLRTFKAGMQSGSSVPVWSMSAPPAVEGTDYSDHQSYRAVGYPAIMVTDTAFFRNHAYHTADDTPDRLSYDRMAEVVAGLETGVRALAR